MGEQIGGFAVSTYERIRTVLADGDWHTVEELREVSFFPERWINELRIDGLEVVEDDATGKVALVGSAASA
jgi:hypothetical protein